MKKFILICAATISFNSQSDSTITVKHSNPDTVVLNVQAQFNKPRWGAGKTLGTGITIGAISGLLAYGLDTANVPGSWIIGFLARKLLLHKTQGEIERGGHAVDETLLHESAWVTDWATYLGAWSVHLRHALNNMLHRRLPQSRSHVGEIRLRVIE